MDKTYTGVAQMSEEEQIQQALNRKARKREKITLILPAAGLVFLVIFFSIASKGIFLDPFNLTNLINQCYALTVIAIGAAFVYANGSMDMSVGATFALSQLLMAYALKANIPIIPAMLICIAVAVFCASIVANIHIRLSVPVFIGSMCVGNICTGILTYAVSESDVFISYAQYGYLDSWVVKAIVLVVFILIAGFFFKYTMLGKNLKALGGNAEAAKISGVRRTKVLWIGFVALGVCVGVSAIFSLMRTNQVTGATGSGMNLDILVAVVLGGFPLTGGARARFISPILGALMVTVLDNGIQLLGFNTAVANFATGILFLVVIALTYDKSKGILIN